MQSPESIATAKISRLSDRDLQSKIADFCNASSKGTKTHLRRLLAEKTRRGGTLDSSDETTVNRERVLLKRNPYKRPRSRQSSRRAKRGKNHTTSYNTSPSNEYLESETLEEYYRRRGL